MTSTIPLRSETRQGIAYLRAGTGMPVILLHGVGLRAEAWQSQIEGLSARHDLIAPELPGHGGSAPIGGPAPDLRDFADRIGEAIAETARVPALIVGHSMGAMIALDLAIRRPDLCCGVVALNAIFQRPDAARQAVLARAEALAKSEDNGVEAPLRRWFGDCPDGRNRAAADACRDWLSTVDRAGYAAAYGAFARHDGPSLAALRGLSVPALFLTGAQDPNSTPAMSEAMAALVPDGQLRIVDGAAHMVPMTHCEAVNAALAEFFEECRGTKGAA
ncbi:alpha/beta fold hydrolase [Pacificispira sp.]|uniref:alpha/beta fold hydrolase n=1 Tax=Pacificispira sp. TaxID=2888761 RepID=UPI003BAC4825